MASITEKANLVSILEKKNNSSLNTKKARTINNLTTPKKSLGLFSMSFTSIYQANDWFKNNNNISITNINYRSMRNFTITYRLLDSYNGTYQFEQCSKFNVLIGDDCASLAEQWKAQNPGKTYIWSSTSSFSYGKPSMLLLGLPTFQRISGVVLYKGL